MLLMLMEMSILQGWCVMWRYVDMTVWSWYEPCVCVSLCVIIILYYQEFSGELGDDNTILVGDVNSGMNVTVSCLFNRFFTSK